MNVRCDKLDIEELLHKGAAGGLAQALAQVGHQLAPALFGVLLHRLPVAHLAKLRMRHAQQLGRDRTHRTTERIARSRAVGRVGRLGARRAPLGVRMQTPTCRNMNGVTVPDAVLSSWKSRRIPSEIVVDASVERDGVSLPPPQRHHIPRPPRSACPHVTSYHFATHLFSA